MGLLDEALSVAVLVFQTASARTRIVAAYALIHLDRSIGLLLSVCSQVVAAGLKLAHISPALHCTLRPLVGITQWHEGPEKEGEHIPVEGFKHLCKEVVALEFVNHYRVLLFVGSVLDALLELVHLPEVLLPMLIDLEKDDILAEGLGNFPSF